MMNRPRVLFASILLLAGLAPTALSQPNTNPNLDVYLGRLDELSRLGRAGAYPNGEVGLAMSTTSCNVGTVDVPWHRPMNPDHPFISFLLVRTSNDRIEQVSNRSYVKHGFYALSSSQCDICQNGSPTGTWLGVGCSDTYSVSSNSNNSYLGPADEINPWSGEWDPICSHFDKGQPPVSPPYDCDGIKESINPPDAPGNRVRVKDGEFLQSGTFYYQSYYVVLREGEDKRDNNWGSRRFIPSWSGTKWNITIPSSNPKVDGSVLQRWTGSTLTSATNGSDDGRILLAVKTFDLGNGTWRYEYAMQNRDNHRGVGSFEIPVCPNATVSQEYFGDIDSNAGNDWSITRTSTSLVFDTASNPLKWNSIFNFSFVADVAPDTGATLMLGAHAAGSGSDFYPIAGTAPMGATNDVDLGYATVGSNGLAPELTSCGDLSAGNGGYAVLRNAKASTLAFIFAGPTSNPTPVKDSSLVPVPPQVIAAFVTGADGSLALPIAGGMGPGNAYLQFLIQEPTLPFDFSFSNALQVPLLP